MVEDGAFIQKLGYNFIEVLNLKGHKSHYWFKSHGNFAEWADFAYWWSSIGKGLRLQPAQQACLSRDRAR